MADYAVFFSVFGGLFYLDNRKKYRLPSGKTDTTCLRRDLKKLFASMGIAEVIYTIFRWVLQYYLLQAGHDPYMASIISQAISTVIYMGAVNLGISMTRLWRHED